MPAKRTGRKDGKLVVSVKLETKEYDYLCKTARADTRSLGNYMRMLLLREMLSKSGPAQL